MCFEYWCISVFFTKNQFVQSLPHGTFKRSMSYWQNFSNLWQYPGYLIFTTFLFTSGPRSEIDTLPRILTYCPASNWKKCLQGQNPYILFHWFAHCFYAFLLTEFGRKKIKWCVSLFFYLLFGYIWITFLLYRISVTYIFACLFFCTSINFRILVRPQPCVSRPILATLEISGTILKNQGFILTSAIKTLVHYAEEELT